MLTNIIKRTVPQGLQRRLNEGVYRYLGLHYKLASGVEIEIGSKTDWLSYNTIFQSGEYDAGITTLLDYSGPPAVVLDLGCNTGFFTLRCLDLLGREAFTGKLTWVAVDASGAMLDVYRNRVFARNGLEGAVQLVHGLVGERSGAADFFESTNTGANTFCTENLEEGRRYTKKRVTFVDLDRVLPPGPIALVKCDIEGGEAGFIKNYRELARRTQTMIFEFHDFCEDCASLIQILKDDGFTHRTLRTVPGSSIELFTRLGSNRHVDHFDNVLG